MKLMWFCIPAHGHTNPTIEVVRELTGRGHEVRYYSFADFREKIEGAGAVFVPCDAYLPPVDEAEKRRLKRVSTTEMSVQSFKTTERMDAMLAEEIAAFQPDGIVSDSACFWGKLTAVKYKLPMVCSTTTFAFNRYSSQYMKHSAAELADMILGLPRMERAMRSLRKRGYEVKSALDIVQNKNDTDTIVFTSVRFQPCVESFDPAHYRFVGPSLRPVSPKRQTEPPLVYVALGTVLDGREAFFRACIEALGKEKVELLISCGRDLDPASLGPLPANVRVEQSFDQLAVLEKASLFLTHCGMNSASEGLYLGVPELLYPQTGEQQAVARRVAELGAGIILTPADANPAGIRLKVLAALTDEKLQAAAAAMREDLTACSGPKGAADFIEEVCGKAHTSA